jgi:hypothetical protein
MPCKGFVNANVRYQSNTPTSTTTRMRATMPAASLIWAWRAHAGRQVQAELPREQPVRPLLHPECERQRSIVVPRRADLDLAAGQRHQLGAAARDVFRYFSVKLDVKF